MMAEPLPDEVKIDYKNRKYDLVIYGATGFTGAIAANEFVKRYATSNINFKWAISGRNAVKLNKLRVELQNSYKLYLNDNKDKEKEEYMSNLTIIIADINNLSSLSSMIESTKLVISCIGPYRLIGERVVELCSIFGTDYVDICGEPEFMERCAFKYYSKAQETGAIIVSACGFDSIPSDIGCLFIDEFYISNGGICSSINGYLTGRSPDGYQVHDTTLKAAIYGLKEADKLRSLRKEIDEKKDYKISKKKIMRSGLKQIINKEIYFWSDEVSKYSMLFPFADSSVVANSQGITAALLHSQNIKNKTFPQYAAYISFNSYWNVLQALSIGGLSKLLINYEFGRNLLMDYPEYITFGVFSENGPTKKQRETQTFSFKFFAKGYSKSLCIKYDYNTDKLNKLNCDFNINASVSGKDIAYSGTSKILIECAITLLEEKNRINTGDLTKGFPAIKGGVFTPSTVFGNTSLIERLNEAGITFIIQFDDDDDDDDDDNSDSDNAPLIQQQQNNNNNNNNNNNKESSDDFEVINKPKNDHYDITVNMKNNQNNDEDQEYDYNKFNNIHDDDDDVPR